MTDLPLYLTDLIQEGRLAQRQGRGLIYRALCRAAKRGDRCPTGDMLCEITGFSPATTVYHVSRLEADGLIRVWRYQRSRVVEIVATGAKTAASGEKLPHWRVRRSIQLAEMRG
ncbi:MAG: hypothetical protein INR68_16760 [Methylobacterium mesophilicum]|nr:hypothetical protein [Methylobacterium mesophilicum]